MVPVKLVMTKKILKVRTGTSVKKVAEMMRNQQIGSVLVADKRNLLRHVYGGWGFV